jgi:bile acid-coenzyme A ligase
VHAIVEVADGTTEDELRTHLADRLIRYKTPRTYDFVDGPLRDDAGKVRKSALVADIVARAAADA